MRKSEIAMYTENEAWNKVSRSIANMERSYDGVKRSYDDLIVLQRRYDFRSEEYKELNKEQAYLKRRMIGYEMALSVAYAKLADIEAEIRQDYNMRAIACMGEYMTDYEYEINHHGYIRGTKL